MGEMPDWLRPPPDTPEHMLPAWLGALHHALGSDETVAAFRAETGIRWRPGKMTLERMIDRATGSDERFLREFVGWFNLNIWGPLDCHDDQDLPP